MERYVKIPIFPITKYMTAKERKQMPAPMKPVSFMFDLNEVVVDDVLDCNRGVSRKVGGRGFRYVCRVRWCCDDIWHSKNSVLWYDDFLCEWFVEVPESRKPDRWEMPTQLTDVANYLENGSANR